MFLQADQAVVPTLSHDYPDWHKGRDLFSLWYIEIVDPELLAYLSQLRADFSDLLYSPNQRQFHITLFICGFLTESKAHLDDDFNIELLKQQYQLLKHRFNTSFKLKTAQINSFESALFVEVEATEFCNPLQEIRKLLGQTASEIAALDYCPHITLGLYKDSINSDIIFAKIKLLQQQRFEFKVEQLTFGTYQPRVLQGRLTEYHQHILAES